MADNVNSTNNTEQDTQQTAVVKFCPICGTQMVQEIRYGFLCWVCPECDYDEPI